MKALLSGSIVAAVAIGVVIWEESRVAELKAEIAALKETGAIPSSSAAPGSVISGPGGTIASKSEQARSGRSGPAATDPQVRRDREDRALGETIRKIFENPAGVALINEENKGKATRIYGDLIDQLDLTRDEEEYFIDLLAPGISEEDMTGMKLLNAKSGEESMKILDDMEAAQEKRRQAIKAFLNSDEDFVKYEHYQARKSEHEQLPGIRSVMTAAGAPLKPEQETALVEAMFEARNETGLSDRWEGRAGFMQFAEPGISTRFEEDWGAMQDHLNGKTRAILDEAQGKALSEQQGQVKEFVLMSIRMAESMTKAANQ